MAAVSCFFVGIQIYTYPSLKVGEGFLDLSFRREAIRDLDSLRVAFGEASGEKAEETNAALDALAKRLEEVISATGLGGPWCTSSAPKDLRLFEFP